MPPPKNQGVDHGQDAKDQEEQAAAVPGAEDGTMEDGQRTGDNEPGKSVDGNDASAGDKGVVVDRDGTAADVGGLEGVKILLRKERTFEEYITVSGYVYEEKVTGKCAVMDVYDVRLL